MEESLLEVATARISIAERGERRLPEGAEGRIFTRYVESLGKAGEPPRPESFAAVWSALRGALQRELSQRGLWLAPPRYLGVVGWERWTEGPKTGGKPGSSDALDELVADAYVYIFVERLDRLRAQLDLKPNVDGLVYRSVRHFVLERQKKQDPLGVRVFKVLHSAVEGTVRDGSLHLLQGDTRIRNDTVLAFVPGPARMAGEDELADHVARWNDTLLPGLVTTKGRGQNTLLAAVRDFVLRLEDKGVEAFSFGLLLGLMKRDVRYRWSATWEQAAGDTGLESTDGELARLVPLVAPELGFESRQSLRRLIDCVEREIAGRVGDARTAEELRAIWETLLSWSTEAQDAGRDAVSLRSESTPSHREIASLLEIPRARLPGLYDKLGAIVRACRQAERSPDAPLEPSSPTSGIRAMNDLKTRLRKMTGDAMARASRDEDEARGGDSVPQPGDVFLLREAADWLFEWVVVEAAGSGKWLTVPADAEPPIGDADVVVSGEQPGGPLTLRCAHAVSLPSGIFRREMLVRRFPFDVLKRAGDRIREWEADEDSAVAVDVILDPEERAVLEELGAAVEALRTAVDMHGEVDPSSEDPGQVLPFEAPARTRDTSRAREQSAQTRMRAIAAVFATAAVGLSALALWQWREIRRWEEPTVVPHHETVTVTEIGRDELVWKIPAGANRILLYVRLGRHRGCDPVWIELLDAERQALWESGETIEPPGGEVKLDLPTGFLKRGVARLRVTGRCDGERRLLDDREVSIHWMR